MVTRFYFPSSGTAPATPANDAEWNQVFGGTALPLTISASGTTSDVGVTATENSTTFAWDVLYRKFVSTDTISTDGTIAGTFTGQVALAINTTVNNGATVYLVVRVVSGDGATVRGTVFKGPVSGTPGAANVRTAYAVATQTLTPVAALAGDRLEVQIGPRFNNVSGTNKAATIWFGEAPADIPAGTNNVSTTGRMWLEFSADLFAAGDPVDHAASASLTGASGLAASLTVALALQAGLSGQSSLTAVAESVAAGAMRANLSAVSSLTATLDIPSTVEATTETRDLSNGRTRLGSAEDLSTYPVPTLPAHLTTEPHRIMAQQLPAPVLVDGKPTT